MNVVWVILLTLLLGVVQCAVSEIACRIRNRYAWKPLKQWLGLLFGLPLTLANFASLFGLLVVSIPYRAGRSERVGQMGLVLGLWCAFLLIWFSWRGWKIALYIPPEFPEPGHKKPETFGAMVKYAMEIEAYANRRFWNGLWRRSGEGENKNS